MSIPLPNIKIVFFRSFFYLSLSFFIFLFFFLVKKEKWRPEGQMTIHCNDFIVIQSCLPSV